MRKLAAIGILVILGFGLSGCSSTVKRDVASVRPLTVQPVSSVNVFMTEAGKTKLSENIKFNTESLREIVERTLSAIGLVKKESPVRLDIAVDDVRVRSTFSAIMWGFMAGDDRVNGTVTLVGGDGALIDKFDVSASYALGGLAGGQDSARMSYLYEAFAQSTVDELQGKIKADTPK